jgi:excisionase family DNA binding protein
MHNATQALEDSRNEFMTAKKAAEYLGVSVNSFRRMWRSRAIPAHYITPCRAKFKRLDLDEWLRGQRVVFGSISAAAKNESQSASNRVKLRRD